MAVWQVRLSGAVGRCSSRLEV